MSETTILPDGSAFSIMALPLPKDHWIYHKGDDGFSLPPPMGFRMIDCPQRKAMADKIRDAVKYAVRGATMHGEEFDFDPDALMQLMVVGMLGYHTPDGLGSEKWENPSPVPPTHGWYAHSEDATNGGPDHD